MTPLAQDVLPTMATVSVSRSSPNSSSSPCSQTPPSPSSSNSANAKLFRPWGQALDENTVEDRKSVVQEVHSSSLRKRRREGGVRKGIRETSRGKKSQEADKKPVTATPDVVAPAEALRSPSGRLPLPGSRVEPTEVDYSMSSLCGSALVPPPVYPHHPAHPATTSHLLQSPSSSFLHYAQPHHIPPHLDPVLLAEMTEAELERMGLLGCGVGDVAAVCGASSGSTLSTGAVKKQRPKKYRCPHCQVAFSNNGQLRGHVRIHTGERPFHCEYEGCGKAFTRNEELTRHRRIHSGQRPFACPLCEKRFGRKDHLKKHARTHAPPPSAHQYLLPHHSDPRFLLAGSAAGGAFVPPQSYLLGSADAAGLAHSQRVMEMAALSGFPYLYGY